MGGGSQGWGWGQDQRAKKTSSWGGHSGDVVKGRGPNPWEDSHALALHNIHVVLCPGVVAVRAQCPPEVGPQLPGPRHHWRHHFPGMGGCIRPASQAEM